MQLEVAGGHCEQGGVLSFELTTVIPHAQHAQLFPPTLLVARPHGFPRPSCHLQMPPSPNHSAPFYLKSKVFTTLPQ